MTPPSPEHKIYIPKNQQIQHLTRQSPTANPPSHTINLIDTPGHADFTFEVIRSLRILDGAICILDGVAGVEAQTEKVWHQASGYDIPRLIYVNKLDREGAAFGRTVREVAARLNTWPALCQIPWWKDGQFVGVGDVVGFNGMRWQKGGDGSDVEVFDIGRLRETDARYAGELLTARKALIEVLTEHDDILVDEFLSSGEDWEGLSKDAITQSLRRIMRSGGQKVTPVFAGASFRNIGVQPLLDAVNHLLPSPPETKDPATSLGKDHRMGLRQFLSGKDRPRSLPQTALSKLTACALAFKVVNDPRRGVLVYVRVYSGSLHRNTLLYNTNLATTERSMRILRMYAADAVEVQAIDEGHIGVIVGLKHARTGDTLIVYTGATPKHTPPSPIDNLQLQPIDVPPPLFFASVEPNSLAEEKPMNDALAMLLREDPSLSVSIDSDSGQTHLAGMGELHLEIARDKLLGEYKAKAEVGKIEIGYREAVTSDAGPCTETFDREVAGKRTAASSTASVRPAQELVGSAKEFEHMYELQDGNILCIEHPTISGPTGKTTSSDVSQLPLSLPFGTCLSSLHAGAVAALARGPSHSLPVHSTAITVSFDPATNITLNTTSAALTSAARLAVSGALRASAKVSPTIVMEPVMVATIAVNEASLGAVVHDISSARGGHVLSLDAEGSAEDSAEAQRLFEEQFRLTPAQLERVYAPPDPFGSGGRDVLGDAGGAALQRRIRARVPLKEMVGYLKHLRSLTGGRGTFVMSVDKFERMSGPRMKAALAEMRGDI